MVKAITTSILCFVPLMVVGCGSDTSTPSSVAPDNAGKSALSLRAGALRAGALSAGDALDADYVRVPNVGQVHKSCYHQVAKGSRLNEHGAIQAADGTVQPAFPPCAFPEKRSRAARVSATSGAVSPPGDDGYQATSTMRWSVPMRQYGASFHVPAAPPIYSGQTVYLFPAMEDDAGTNIIQPVLQYGPSPAGGGAFWAIAAWVGGQHWGGNYYSSELRAVSTGEALRGGMFQSQNCTTDGACDWHVVVNDSNNTNYLDFDSYVGFAWTWVFAGALEVHNFGGCDEYPATYENFYDFFLQDGHYNGIVPNWDASINNTCDKWINVINSNLVEIHYNGH